MSFRTHSDTSLHHFLYMNMENNNTIFSPYSNMQLIIMLDGMMTDVVKSAKAFDRESAESISDMAHSVIDEMVNKRNLSTAMVNDWMRRYKTGELN